MVKNRAQKIHEYSPSLVKLGLTPDEAKCYQSLVSSGAMPPKTLANNIHILPNAVYRLLESLITKGFAVRLDSHPTTFQAIPPQVAIPAFSKNQIRGLEEAQSLSLADLTSAPVKNLTEIKILTGRNAMFQKAADMINEAKKEVLIISIGEPTPEEITLADRDALARGVIINFIAHKYDKENQALLESWAKMGLVIRHYPGSGYHLSITDGKTCLIAASNPKNPAERVSMFITSPDLSRAMRSYFYSLWAKSHPISP